VILQLPTSQNGAQSLFKNSSIDIPEAFHPAVIEMARDAYREQGMRAFENTKRAAAFHEAGHAIVFAAEGLPVKFGGRDMG
jgi:hypothetical protein